MRYLTFLTQGVNKLWFHKPSGKADHKICDSLKKFLQ